MSRRALTRTDLLRATVVIVGVTLATWVLHVAGALDQFETTGLDALNLVRPALDPDDVVLVAIQDQEYRDPALFNGTSPLDCATLRRVIAAVGAGRPAVIGVDLDTSDPGFTCLKSEQDWPPIVWVQDAVWNPDSRVFSVVPALAGDSTLLRPQDADGIGALPQDADGVVRWYWRDLPLPNQRTGQSFPWAVIQTACKHGCTRCCQAAEGMDPTQPLRLNFAGQRFGFQPLSVRHVLAAAEGAESSAGWLAQGPLAGKIVLIGGTYRAARDIHATPVGPMSGVQIMAQAIESDLHGGGIRPVHGAVMVILDVLLGYFIMWLHHRLHDRVTLALWLTLLGMPVLCLAASYAAFSTLGLWFNFATVIASVLIHQLYERARENQRLRAAAVS